MLNFSVKISILPEVFVVFGLSNQRKMSKNSTFAI